jgi:predicted dienelactone hydrolase
MNIKKHTPKVYRTGHSIQHYQMWLLVAILLCTIVLPSVSCRSTDIKSGSRDTRIGFTIYDFTYVNDEGAEEVLTTAVWYPTKEKPHPFTYNNEFTSSVAPDAAPDKERGPYPLIIFNHGLYASGIRSLPLTEHLASQGYIVAAPDFTDTKPLDFVTTVATDRIKGTEGITKAQDVLEILDDFTQVMADNQEVLLDYLEKFRLKKSRSVIDSMLVLNNTDNSPFYGLINEDAIGMAGHSLGGLTTLGLIGKHYDPAMKDSRIKAALILSAPAYPFEGIDTHIDTPIMVIYGEYDLPSLKPDVLRTVAYDNASAPKYYAVLKNCSHFAFSNTPCKNYDSIPECQECDSKVQVINSYSTAFFNRYLKQDYDTGKILQKTDDMFYLYEYEED